MTTIPTRTVPETGWCDDDGIWRAYTDDAYAHLAADLGAYGVPGRVEDSTGRLLVARS